MSRSAAIVSCASYLPEREVPNAELNAHFAALGQPEVIAKFANRTGIQTRFYAPDDWATSDLALPAAREALKRAGRSPDDVDLIILGTDTPDYITPSTSVILQHKLGAKNAGSFDVGCACASFATALATASGIIATNPGIKTILVVGVYMMHKLADPDDPTIFFYGDGAGAVLVEAVDKQGFVGAAFRADGAYSSVWGIFSGGTVEPTSQESFGGGRTQVRVTGRSPPEINDVGWPLLFERLARENDFSADDVDHLIFTQISKPTIELAAKNCGVPVEKCPIIMDRFGYTGSACVPIALNDIMQRDKVKSGDLVVMICSGVGYNQAAVAIRMP